MRVLLTKQSLDVSLTDYPILIAMSDGKRSNSIITTTESLSIYTTSYYYPTEEPEGSIGAHRCQAQPNLPLYMVMSGGATIVFWLLCFASMVCKSEICNKGNSSRAERKDQPVIYCAGVLIMVLAFFFGKYC